MIFDFSSFPALTTRRLHMRQLTHADAAGIQAIFSDPGVLRFLNTPPVDTLEKAVSMINWLNEQYEKRAEIDWGITLHGETTLIGMCGCYAWECDNRHADIGYHILPAHWGKGYATEATRAMLTWAFEALDLHRIQADCTEGNIASERVMLKCGFQLEGIWRESCWEHGRFVNIKQFGLLLREFQET